MAKVIERKHPTKPYLVRWFKPKQGQRGFATQAEAENFLATVEGGQARVSHCETLREYADRWQAQTGPHKRYSTVVHYEWIFRLYIYPVLGDVRLDKITREKVKDLVLGSGLSPSMADRVNVLLHTVFKEAVRDGKLTDNPAAGIKVDYGPKRADIVPATFEQLTIIEQALRPEWGLALWLMIGAGLRIGEALAVRADSVREDGTMLRVEESIVNGSHRPGRPIIGPLKHRKPMEFRDVPLATWLLDKIEAYIAQFGIEPGKYLFEDFASGRYNTTAFNSRFDVGRKRAGIPDMHPHMCRHIWASTMLAGGVPLDSVARYLGHKDSALTHAVYGHLMPSSNVQAREVSDKAMEEFKLAA